MIIRALRCPFAKGRQMLYDRDIREALFDFLDGYFGDNRTLEEKNIGSVRADVIMVTPGFIAGLEIKSDADTYDRLAGQVKEYDRWFDLNYVVTGKSHVTHMPEHVPSYWGIISAYEDGDGVAFDVVREASRSPKTRNEKKLSLLWRPELAEITAMNSMPAYRSLGRRAVIEKILERVPSKIPQETLDGQICSLLMERDYSNVEAMLAEYRKSPTEKLLEQTDDPAEIARILNRNAELAARFGKKKKRRRRKTF